MMLPESNVSEGANKIGSVPIIPIILIILRIAGRDSLAHDRRRGGDIFRRIARGRRRSNPDSLAAGGGGILTYSQIVQQ